MKPKGFWVYRVHYKKQVIKFLQNQNETIRKRVVGFFDEIKENPYDFQIYDVKAMQGLDLLGFMLKDDSNYDML